MSPYLLPVRLKKSILRLSLSGGAGQSLLKPYPPRQLLQQPAGLQRMVQPAWAVSW